MIGVSGPVGFNFYGLRVPIDNNPLKKDPDTKDEHPGKKGISKGIDYSAGLTLGMYPYNTAKIEKKYEEPAKVDKNILAKQKKIGLYDSPMGKNAADLNTEIKRNYQDNAARLNKSPYTAKEKAEGLAIFFPKNRDKALFILIYLKNRNPKLFSDIMGELKKQLGDNDYSWLTGSLEKIAFRRNGQLFDLSTDKELRFSDYHGTDPQSKREEASWIQQGIQAAMFNNFSQTPLEKELSSLKQLGSKPIKLSNESNPKTTKPDISSAVPAEQSKAEEAVVQRTLKELDKIYREFEKKAEEIFSKIDKETAIFHKNEIKKLTNALLSTLINEEKKLQIKFEAGKLDAEGLEAGKKQLNEIAEFVKERYRQIFPA